MDKLDDTVGDLAQAPVKERAERIERQKETADRQKEMADRQKYLDDRVDRLVSAIGEFVRKQN